MVKRLSEIAKKKLSYAMIETDRLFLSFFSRVACIAQMRLIATRVARFVLGVSVCLSACVFVRLLGTPVSLAKTDRPIEIPVGADSRWAEETVIHGDAHWNHLANTIE